MIGRAARAVCSAVTLLVLLLISVVMNPIQILAAASTTVNVLPTISTNTTIDCYVSATAQLFMQQAVAYYGFFRPDLHINVHLVDNTPARSGSQLLFDEMVAGGADYSFSTLVPTDAQKALAPDLMHFPAAAFPYGAVYSLPTLAVPLILDMKTLARIHSANITRWNDPAIVALNPAARLPNVGIEVVLLSDSATYVNAATGSFRTADDDFRARFPQSSLPNWPYNQYYKYVTTYSLDGIGSYVRANPYTIGLSLLFQATAFEVTIANMVNDAGVVVAASFASVHSGFNDQAVRTSMDPDGTIVTEQVDLIEDAPGIHSWPMLIQGTFTLAKSFSRASCTQRTELIKFLLFILDSETVQFNIAASLLTAFSSKELDSAIGLRNALQTNIMCEDLPINVGSSKTTTTTAGYAALSSGSNMNVRLLLLERYALSDPSTQYAITVMDEKAQLDILVEAQRSGEIDLGWIFPMTYTKIYNEDIEEKPDSLAFLPTAVAGIMPTYSLDPTVLSSMQSMSALPLQIDMETLAQVFVGTIDSWLHPSILAFNPKLAAAFASAPLVSPRMNRVLFGSGRMEDAPLSALSNHLILALNHTTTFQNSGFPWGLPADWTPLTARLDGMGVSYYMAASESSMESQIAYRFGSIGYKLIESNFTDPTTDFDIVRYVTSGDSNKQVVVKGVPASFQQCLDQVEMPDDDPLLNVDLESMYDDDDEAVAGCWPILILNLLVLSSDVDSAGLEALSSDAGPSEIQHVKNSLCYFRNKAVHFMQYLALDTNANAAIRMLGQESFSESSRWSDAILNELMELKCLDEYMLYQPDEPWLLSRTVFQFVLSTATIGLAGVILAAILVWRHRNRTIIMASDPVLQSCSLTGLALLLISTILFVQPATDHICSGLSWILPLGFTLVLSPQALKLLKVHLHLTARKNKKRVSVVRTPEVTRKHMYIAMAVLITIDIALLIASQLPSTAAGLFNPLSIIRSRDADANLEYITCAPDSNSMPYAVPLFAVKVITLFTGAGIGFRVRHVASAFGESTKISWSLWSATVSGVIVIPLIALTGGVHGDLFVFLACFFVLWLALGTLALLFGYKVYAILREAWNEYQQHNRPSHRSNRSSGGVSSSNTTTRTATGTGTGTGTSTGTTQTGTNSVRSLGTTSTGFDSGHSDICQLPDIVGRAFDLYQLRRYINALERQLEKAKLARAKDVAPVDPQPMEHSDFQFLVSNPSDDDITLPNTPSIAAKYAPSPILASMNRPQGASNATSPTFVPIKSPPSERKRLQPRQTASAHTSPTGAPFNRLASASAHLEDTSLQNGYQVASSSDGAFSNVSSPAMQQSKLQVPMSVWPSSPTSNRNSQRLIKRPLMISVNANGAAVPGLNNSSSVPTTPTNSTPIQHLRGVETAMNQLHQLAMSNAASQPRTPVLRMRPLKPSTHSIAEGRNETHTSPPLQPIGSSGTFADEEVSAPLHGNNGSDGSIETQVPSSPPLS